MQIYQMIEKHFKPVPLDRPVVFQQQRGNRIEASTIKTRQKKKPYKDGKLNSMQIRKLTEKHEET